jgi:hypothetical protein
LKRHVTLWCCLWMLSVVLSGCATNIGAPQSSGEFVKMMKEGGLFRNAEKVSVNSPAKSVVADLTAFADKCLKVRTFRAGNYATRESASSTTYHPKIVKGRKSATALVVQEQYNDRDDSGAPTGGIFTLVAEVNPSGKKTTDVDIYYLTGRGMIVDPLKEWMEGNKGHCPSF